MPTKVRVPQTHESHTVALRAENEQRASNTDLGEEYLRYRKLVQRSYIEVTTNSMYGKCSNMTKAWSDPHF